MNEIAPHVSALETLLKVEVAQIDLLELVNETLSGSDPTALRLLLAGVRLQREATRETQRKGIRKAQEVVNKYPGRKPTAFGLSAAKRDRLAAMLKYRLDQNTYVDATPDTNISQMAKDLKCSRTTLYRYIKATPELLTVMETLRRRKGQLGRHDEVRASKSLNKAKKVFSQGLENAGISRKDRPILNAVRQARKAKKTADTAHWDAKREEDGEATKAFLVGLQEQLDLMNK